MRTWTLDTRSGLLRVAVASLFALALPLLLLAPTIVRADTPITHFSATPSMTQAGGHPDLEINFALANRVDQGSTSECNCEDAKDATVHLPPGFIGNPHAAPQCTLAEFSADKCPIDSQIGIVTISASNGIPFDSAVYNLVPPPEDAGLLGFKLFLFNSPQFTVLSSRTGSDYGLDAKVTSIYHGAYPLETFQEVLWGVPADPSHNNLRIDSRYNPNGVGNTSFIGQLCNSDGTLSTDDPNTVKQLCNLNFASFPPTPSNSPSTPYLQNPTTCGAPLTAGFEVLSYDGGVTNAAIPWPEMSGCDQLSFNPSLYANPTTTSTETASGIDVNLTIPQQESPTIPSPSPLKAATVSLPPGFSINPNAADGKVACLDSEASFGTLEAAHCPEYAKVGSLEIESSALPGPLPGSVYLGQPLPGNRYRLFLVADGFGTHVKLAGSVAADPSTGQLTISFPNLPETPLTAFNMHFFGSERGLLATPQQCGTYAVTSTFAPWDESIGPRTSTQYFTLTSGPGGSPCPGPALPFQPTFQAASASNTAGAHTSFSIDLKRPDGDQALSSLKVTTPPGFSATIAGVPYCSDSALAAAASANYSGLAEIASPSCPAASQIGTSIAAAGAGDHPLYVPGNVYLAGPYKGAPLSLAVITPAVSGPYDLGNVVLRVAIQVDPIDAHITASSDLLPQILGGIPLRLREVRVDLNRPNFTLNPTNCSDFAVTAQALGNQGAVAELSERFQVANCRSLPFEPKLGLRVTGGVKRSQNPALHARLAMKGGEANIATAAVTLPHSEFLDNAHIESPCTRVQFAANQCPPASLIGFARAETPLLGQPLEGPIYLRSSSHKLPDVVAALKGQVELNLDGQIDSAKGRLRATFRDVPDAPVSSVALDFFGGSKGLLENSTELCEGDHRAVEKLIGQNGKVDKTTVSLGTPCPANRKRRAQNRRRPDRARTVR